ncbi:MAG: N-6 DNA methylase [Tepidisphaeraceae bacterium]
MPDTREGKLQAFVEWSRQHITGDEKGEAQIYIDRLFQAFGQPGSREVGGSPEMRIKKASEDGGGTSFADYVWKPVVLIEMKKRGVDLRKHYRQAFDYWARLVPGRPRYVVLCNFDEFHVYDFDRQLDTPLDIVKLSELPNRWGPLAFLFPTNEKPHFDNDREAVTRAAADNLAQCFNLMTVSNRQPGPVDRATAQRFILQTLVALFAEDIALLPKYMMSGLLDDVKSPADAFDLIGGLFQAMNRREGNTGGRYRGVPYFNGGIFREPAQIELNDAEVAQLKVAAKSDWSKVSPDIFGTLFEHSLGKNARHAFGAHYTSPIDIAKIVGPTVVAPWTDAIESARSAAALLRLLEKLTALRVLDPACGSGNFLYIAYREMKRLEGRIRERLTLEFPGEQPRLLHVNARQFYGLDVNGFAVELAKVSMMIGRKLAIDELHILDEPPLPLDNLDQNFREVDALFSPTDDGSGGMRSAWPPADVIIGNPPFLGAKLLKPERGPKYVKTLRKLYDEVPGMADYCVYWIKRAHDHLPACTKTEPLIGRAGLVGTQNIRNNASREGGLDYVVATGTIVEAVDNQPWSGEANVHVSIVNWMKSQDTAIVPKVKRLWSKLQPKAGGKRPSPKKGVRADKTYELQDRECEEISASLSDRHDVSGAIELELNTKPKRVYQGITPGHAGFVLSDEERDSIVQDDRRSGDVIFPYLIGRELLTGDGTPERWLIDFQQRDIVQAQRYQGAFARVQEAVLPDRQANADKDLKELGEVRSHHKQFLDRWWKLAWDRADMVEAIAELQGRYVVCSRVTKRPIFVFVSAQVRPGDALQTFMFDDDYSFGILQANPHFLWFVTNCSRLTERYRYTAESIFDTYPWPQTPSKKQIDIVATAARRVRESRKSALGATEGGLRAVYRLLELPGKHPLREAHAALDAAVLDAYGFSAKKDLLKQLLDLNHQVSKREKAGESVTAPGVPQSYGDTAKLVTDDCVRPA